MTIDEIKTWLKRYGELERQIDDMTEKIQRLASVAEKTTVTFSSMPSGGQVGSPQERTVELISELQEQIFVKIGESEKARVEIEKAIEGLAKQKHREVLRCRYLRHMKWELIAVYLNYDYRWVTRLHGEALELLAPKSP